MLKRCEPVPEISTNHQISKPSNLSRSTPQGCPVRPLLLLFAFEPLVMAIRQLSDITGMTEHCLSLIADDTVLFLKKARNLTQGPQPTVEVIRTFLWLQNQQ